MEAEISAARKADADAAAEVTAAKEALSALHDLLQDLFLVLDHEDPDTIDDLLCQTD